MRIFLTLLAFSFTLSAFGQATGLPEALERRQAMLVEEGTCQAEWHTLGESPKPIKLGRGVSLWILPCAHWAVNLQASAFLQIEEASQPGGFLYKQVLFIDFDSGRGLRPDNVTFNPRFEEASGTLFSHQDFTASGQCGTEASYRWDSGQQALLLVKLMKREDCRNAKPWEQIYLKL